MYGKQNKTKVMIKFEGSQIEQINSFIYLGNRDVGIDYL